MPLTWDVSAVEDFQFVTTLRYADGTPVLSDSGMERWHPITEMLVWYAMGCGFTGITDGNVADVYARIALVEAVEGPGVHLNGEPYSITLADVVRHIGLTTNATAMTWGEFGKSIRQRIERRRGYLGDDAAPSNTPSVRRSEEVAHG